MRVVALSLSLPSYMETQPMHGWFSGQDPATAGWFSGPSLRGWVPGPSRAGWVSRADPAPMARSWDPAMQASSPPQNQGARFCGSSEVYCVAVHALRRRSILRTGYRSRGALAAGLLGLCGAAAPRRRRHGHDGAAPQAATVWARNTYPQPA
eukprot:COSAG01_NODE_5792_length_4032_cov_12.553776_3_plen_152_part_00